MTVKSIAVTVHSLPNEEQRRILCELIAWAFIEIRHLAGLGKSTRAADLADTFHNVGREIYGWGSWNPLTFRFGLEGYQQQYADDPDGAPRDYISTFDHAFPELRPLIRFNEHLHSLPPVQSGAWHSPDGTVRLLIHIVQSRHAPQPPEAPSPTSNLTDQFYILFADPKRKHWFHNESHSTLSQATSAAEEALGPGVTWQVSDTADI